jgi:hypothetical protein
MIYESIMYLNSSFNSFFRKFNKELGIGGDAILSKLDAIEVD